MSEDRAAGGEREDAHRERKYKASSHCYVYFPVQG